MKKNIIFLCALSFFACNKAESPKLDPLPNIENEILSKKTYHEFEMMPLEKKFAIVNFLDTATAESILRVKSKIAVLESANAPDRKSVKDKSRTAVSATTTEEWLTVVSNSSTIPGEDLIETDSPWNPNMSNGSTVDFVYKWQAFENILGLYKIYSNEKFKLQKEVEQQFKIVGLEHASSYIVGITGGVEWTETLSRNYSQNLYFAWLNIAGTLSGYGITIEKSNSRYVNAGRAYVTSGGKY
jgi:hypothetical protein